jgi:tetratricopeptide (TPR) repeat protein
LIGVLSNKPAVLLALYAATASLLGLGAAHANRAMSFHARGQADGGRGLTLDESRMPWSMIYVPALVAIEACNRSYRHSLKKDWQSTLRDADIALSHNPRLWPAHLNRGVALSKMGQYESALNEYRTCLELHPRHAQAQANLAVCYRNMGAHDKSLEHIDKALKLAKKETWYVVRGVTLSSLERHADALAQFRAILRQNPKNYTVWLLTSQACAALEDKPGAAAALSKGRAVRCGSKQLLAQYEEAMADKRFVDAASHAHSIQLDIPKSWIGPHLLARVHVARREVPEALAALEESLQRDRRQWTPYATRSSLQLHGGHPYQALDDADQALKLNRSWITLFHRANALWMLKRYAEADTDMSDVLAEKPNLVDVLANRGACRLSMGHVEQAQADCDAALRMAPKRPFTLTLQADICMVRGQWGPAFAWAQQALVQNGRYLRGVEFSARSADQLGHREAAQQHYRLFLECCRDWQGELEPDLDDRVHHAQERLAALG